MITSAQLKFIVIDKQEDLPTESEMLSKLHCTTKLEEFIMPNGDIIISNKNISYPLNEKATAICGEEVWGHCYLVKKNVKY